jgi:hypothetical protein
LLKREQIQFAGNPVDEFVGRFTGSAFAEDKANVSLQWTQGDWSVSYLGEYISGLEGGTGFGLDYTQMIPSQYYSDIVASYTYDSTIMVTAGITNITDEAPPFIDVGFNGKTDPSTYRMFGQGYFLRLKWSYE